MKRFRTLTSALLLLLTTGACAVRLGGPSPQQYDAVALAAPAGVAASVVAERLRAVNADVVLLAAADQDSAWFEQVAAEARLTAGRPGIFEGRGFAFLSRLEILGDTTLSLTVPAGGTVAVHDALYRVDRYRFLNTMTVRIDATDLRAAVSTLLGYIAKDVMGHAAVLIAVDGPTPAAADSVATLMRATFTAAAECDAAQLSPELPVRLLYGPVARISCRSAQALPGAVPGVHARVVVGR